MNGETLAILLLKAWQARDVLQDVAMELNMSRRQLDEKLDEVRDGRLSIDQLVNQSKSGRDSSTRSL